jgi:hypothetical protein
LSATLTSGGVPVAGQTVSFTFTKKTTTAVTDASGVAGVTVSTPSKASTVSVSVSFAGTTTGAPQYAPSATSGSVRVA